ncbi:MAG: AAA family ATPase [Pseudonocardiaceae bacterium]
MDRSRESAVLRRLLHDASKGTGRAAVVQGEAGIGKTRQLAEIMAHAAGQGCQVRLGSTDELAQDRPLGPLIEAFGLRADSTDPDRAEIGRLISTDAPLLQAPVVDLGFRVIDSAVALLERLSAATPVVVAFEDLHWADPATLRAVRVIGRALPRLPVLLIVTVRPFPERPELARVIEELVSHGAARLELQLGRRLGEERGNVMWLPLHHALLAVHHIVNGELTDAAAEAQAGLALADEVGIRLHAALLHGTAAWVALQLRFLLSHRFLGPDLVRLAVAAGDRERAAVVTQELADGASRAGVAGTRGAALPGSA